MSCTLTVPDYLGEGIQANPNWLRSFIKTLEKHDSGVADFEIIGLVISDGNWYQMVVHEGRSTQASSVILRGSTQETVMGTLLFLTYVNNLPDR